MDAPFVVAQDLCASYGEGRLTTAVLRGARFQVARGSFTAVVGPSGSGKTTLLALLGGLDLPQSGSLVVDGLELTRLSRSRLSAFRRERVGFVFQAFHLLAHLTARENVEAGLAPLALARAERRRRALDALERVGLADLAERFPQQLAGGEQQRVAVARAVAKRPALLLADEPTGNLDAESARVVLALLRGERGHDGRTVVLATHDAEVAGDADARLRLVSQQVEVA